MDRRCRNPASGASIATGRVTTTCRSPTQTGCSCQRASKLSLDPPGSIVGYVYKRRLKRRAEIACGWIPTAARTSHSADPARNGESTFRRPAGAKSARLASDHSGRIGVTGPWSCPARDRSALRLVYVHLGVWSSHVIRCLQENGLRIVHSADRSASAVFPSVRSFLWLCCAVLKHTLCPDDRNGKRHRRCCGSQRFRYRRRCERAGRSLIWR
jgi:hypothetical protein